MPQLYLEQHRKAKGVSPEAMAGHLGIERESLHRIEREPNRLNPEKQVRYAERLGLESPAMLWQPPEQTSIDALIQSVPEEMRSLATDMAADVVRRLASGAKAH
jgi:DNA-binding XRE family transcriptional regulator